MTEGAVTTENGRLFHTFVILARGYQNGQVNVTYDVRWPRGPRGQTRVPGTLLEESWRCYL